METKKAHLIEQPRKHLHFISHSIVCMCEQKFEFRRFQ